MKSSLRTGSFANIPITGADAGAVYNYDERRHCPGNSPKPGGALTNMSLPQKTQLTDLMVMNHLGVIAIKEALKGFCMTDRAKYSDIHVGQIIACNVVTRVCSHWNRNKNTIITNCIVLSNDIF